MIPLNVLDLSLITQGSTAAEALQRSADLARHAEDCGFQRYWLAEHHSMPGIASAATAVVIGHVAQATSRIRVGSGGIMLPNHAPLTVAEAFGTLESLYPGRIDLGLGRAPGSDQATMRALRRDHHSAERFPQDVMELLAYFGPPEPGQTVIAVPGAGLEVPVWLLGSSLFSAHLAAILGLPFAFASHFAPDMLEEALTLYRTRFEPSARLAKPHAMATVNAIIGKDEAEGRFLSTSLQQFVVALRTARPIAVPPPRECHWSASEQAMLDHMTRYTFSGDAAGVTADIAAFAERLQLDELMIASPIYDHAARKETLSAVARGLIAV